MGYDFKYAGRFLSEFYGVTTSRPPIGISKYDGEHVKIPGRSGSDYIDKKRYEDVQFTLKIGFIIRRLPDDAVEAVKNWLCYLHGYQEFEDSDHPGKMTYADLKDPGDIINELDLYLKAELKFIRVPFWYDKNSMKVPVTLPDAAALEAGVRLFNPYPIESAPLIVLELKPTARTIGGPFLISYRYDNEDDNKSFRYHTSNLPLGTSAEDFRKYVYMDCESGDIYTKQNEDDTDVQYADVDVPDLLKSGQTIFGLESGWVNIVESMKIYPRWRCL